LTDIGRQVIYAVTFGFQYNFFYKIVHHGF